jgi:hypothetical protein
VLKFTDELAFHSLVTLKHAALDMCFSSNKLYVLENSVIDRMQVFESGTFNETDDVVQSAVNQLNITQNDLEMIEQETDNLRKWARWRPAGENGVKDEKNGKESNKKRRAGSRRNKEKNKKLDVDVTDVLKTQ